MLRIADLDQATFPVEIKPPAGTTHAPTVYRVSRSPKALRAETIVGRVAQEEIASTHLGET